MNNAAASNESSRELPAGIQVGTRVFFGRTHGEKTLGKVVKINRTTVKVEQLEGRGTMRDFRVGTIWKVPFMFVTLAPDSATPLPMHKPAAAPAPAWTPAPRAKAVVMEDITRTYSMLSPENLHMDGEISRAAAARRGAALRAKLRELFVEFGREVTEMEAFYR